MSKSTVRVGRELIESAMKSPGVTEQLKVIAERIGRDAESMAVAEGEDDVDIYVESGVRPKGRPYSQVTMKDNGQEFGTYWKPKRAILRRAMERSK